ncbi:MAG: hypothetical protein IK067_00475 [Prevotella sp.]|nr:hypothetical protein [Prevotella sp.]
MDDMNIQKTEVPVIIIEREEEPTANTVIHQDKKRRWMRIIALAVLGLLVASFVGYKLYNRFFNIGISISTTPAQNIEKLQQPIKQEVPEVVMTSDSVLDVAMDFYAIHGLKASIQFEKPDPADTSVYLYTRCADHTVDGQYLGSLVVEGQEVQSDCSRLGYMAMADGNMVIGISRSDKVKDYVLERGGSFFRQFILVSNGQIPARFYLHGKVERRAIGRIGDQLYFIATRHKETLWGFADALREYGFIDAIYITGGTDYCFYRDKDGVRHDIGDSEDSPHEKWKGIIPWVVFRK